jgi:hypothetical protein
VELDQAHGVLSGPGTRKILEREAKLFGHSEYQRLTAISVAHLYNLRNSAGYRRQRIDYTATRPTPVSIGERRKPDPRGRPGYFAWTPCIKAIWMESRAFITSTRLMR